MVTFILTLVLAGVGFLMFKNSKFYNKETKTTKDRWGEEKTETYSSLNMPVMYKVILYVVASLTILIVNPYKLYKVDASGVGIKIDLIGGKRGVSKYNYLSGWNLINTWTEEYKHIPTYQQTVNYEQLQAFAKGGFPVDIQPSFNYSVIGANAGDMYVSLRKPLSEIEQGWLKNSFINSIHEVTNMYTVDYIFSNRELVEKQIEARAKEKCSKWFNISQFRANLAPPKSLQDAVKQEAQAIKEAQAEVQKALKEIEAGKTRVAKAKADSAALIIRASSEAMAIKIKERELSDKYLKLKWIETWNGELPTHQLGNNTGIILKD